MTWCKIILSDDRETYFPGSLVTGKLECGFSQKTTIRSIKMRWKHKESNKWKGHNHTTYLGMHTELYAEQVVFISDLGKIVMNKGTYEFPFSYTLPIDIPSSFQNKFGCIEFQIKAIIDIPWGLDQEALLTFVVNSPMDLNRIAEDYFEKKVYTNKVTSSCWWCQANDIQLIVELPKRAFTNGETVDLKITLINPSDVAADYFKIELLQFVCHTAKCPELESIGQQIILKQFKYNCTDQDLEHTYNVPVAIPTDIEIPNFINCNLLKVKYVLNVTCVLCRQCGSDLAVQVKDIHLGEVPRTNVVEPDSIFSLPLYSIEDSPPPPPPDYDMLPSPPPPYSKGETTFFP